MIEYWYDAPYDLLAKSFSTSNLTHLKLYIMSATSIDTIAKGLPSSCITELCITNTDFSDTETLVRLLDNVARSKVKNLKCGTCELCGDHTDVITNALRIMKLNDLALTCTEFSSVDLEALTSASNALNLKSLHLATIW
jgi:hypothetical protein